MKQLGGGNGAEGKRCTEVKAWIMELWLQEDGNDLVVCAGAAGAGKLGKWRSFSLQSCSACLAVAEALHLCCVRQRQFW